MRLAIVMPTTVVIGIAALRSTCRRDHLRPGQAAAHRGLHVLSLELVADRRPRDPGHERRPTWRQRERGQGEVPELVERTGCRCRGPGTSRADAEDELEDHGGREAG